MRLCGGEEQEPGVLPGQLRLDAVFEQRTRVICATRSRQYQRDVFGEKWSSSPDGFSSAADNFFKKSLRERERDQSVPKYVVQDAQLKHPVAGMERSAPPDAPSATPPPAAGPPRARSAARATLTVPLTAVSRGVQELCEEEHTVLRAAPAVTFAKQQYKLTFSCHRARELDDTAYVEHRPPNAALPRQQGSLRGVGCPAKLTITYDINTPFPTTNPVNGEVLAKAKEHEAERKTRADALNAQRQASPEGGGTTSGAGGLAALAAAADAEEGEASPAAGAPTVEISLTPHAHHIPGDPEDRMHMPVCEVILHAWSMPSLAPPSQPSLLIVLSVLHSYRPRNSLQKPC